MPGDSTSVQQLRSLVVRKNFAESDSMLKLRAPAHKLRPRHRQVKIQSQRTQVRSMYESKKPVTGSLNEAYTANQVLGLMSESLGSMNIQPSMSKNGC